MLEKILYWTAQLSIACIIYFSYSYFSILTSDYSDYFHYNAIESTKESYVVWEDIFFISYITRSQPLYMEYNDILRCNLWEDYTWFSSSKTYSKLLEEGVIISTWRFEWELPKTPAICYLDSQPTAILDFWVRKTQKIQSNYFVIQ